MALIKTFIKRILGSSLIMLTCSSCHRHTQDGVTRFKCPSCGKIEIVRCEHCKITAIKYTCSACDFSGPN
ncbi:RNA-binding protein [Candidatus Woesearchaeota archaeon]|nr:RNA-binding protein [Candidatus Woesearchaeota archaeon]